MATVGRAAALVDLGFLRFSGFFAWVLWLFVHLMKIVEYQNRFMVFTQWAWNYITRNRSARLITGSDSYTSLEISGYNLEECILIDDIPEKKGEYTRVVEVTEKT
jgi:NADH dehydrogenase